jgi:hypothetical protein
VLTAMLAASLTAHADTTTTFSFVDATFTDGATGTGTIFIDTTTGILGAINFTFADGMQSYTFTGAPSQEAAQLATCRNIWDV